MTSKRRLWLENCSVAETDFVNILNVKKNSLNTMNRKFLSHAVSKFIDVMGCQTVSETVSGIKIYETVSYHNNEIDYSEIENSPKIIHFLVLDQVYSIFTISQQHFILVNAIYKLGPNNLVKFEDLGRISLGNMTL